MRFIRKGGRVIPIKEEKRDARIAAGAGAAGAGAAKMAGNRLSAIHAKTEEYHIKAGAGYAANAKRLKEMGKLHGQTSFFKTSNLVKESNKHFAMARVAGNISKHIKNAGNIAALTLGAFAVGAAAKSFTMKDKKNAKSK